jgi:iron-sulfur cluster repair protein YtfE (RIC family)
MRGHLYDYFSGDHKRLEALLRDAVKPSGKIDEALYEQFRKGLLRHISAEEKVLFPAAQESQNGQPLSVAAKLRLDHGALAALLVPPPSPLIVAAIRAILFRHNELEECPGGCYEVCERLVGKNVDKLMERVHAVPEVPTMPHNPKPQVLEATRKALARAGYELDDFAAPKQE